MATRSSIINPCGCRFLSVMIVGLLLGTTCSALYGQVPTIQTLPVAFSNVVGGVSIDADGLLGNATTDALDMLSKLRREAMEKIPGELSQTIDARKVSLRRLDEAIAECAKNGKPLPDAVKYLAGLQHIHYVFVYPEQRDIVLVGPGEGWKVNMQGAVVGVTTGRPVLLLDDLVVALRTAQSAAQGGITCSIDPSPEGIARLQKYWNEHKTIEQTNAAEMENAAGLQNIRVNAVPASSHFACVLVAADYRMKQYAMALESSPVHGLPSYLQMVSPTVRTVQLPRFWLEPRYDALLRSPDGLAWELRGSSVKALTEEDYNSSTGNITHSGKASPVAQKWCDVMTKKYPDLAVADSIFGQLQNCMDLAVVGALVAKEQLAQKAENSLPMLLSSPDVKTGEFNVPKQVMSKASLLKKGHNWVVSVSGGVAINSWIVADQAQASDAVAPERAKAAPVENTAWWWN